VQQAICCYFWRMSSSGMWCRVDLVWTDVSGECIASIFWVENSAQSPSHLLTLVPRSRILSSETSVHTRYTRCQIPEDGILHSHCCENLKSYMLVTFVLFTIFLSPVSVLYWWSHRSPLSCHSHILYFWPEPRLGRPILNFNHNAFLSILGLSIPFCMTKPLISC
jgi:hypothetical protein